MRMVGLSQDKKSQKTYKKHNKNISNVLETI